MPPPKILLVDGYNVIHKIPELKLILEEGLENARLKLALLLSSWSHGHPATECIIIFDGDHQYAGGRDQRLAGIRCFFSRTSHGADSEIIRFAKGYAAKKIDVAVVSDDNCVRNNCRSHGAFVHPSSFILTAKPRPSPRKSKSSPDGKGLNRKAAADINEELKKKFGL